MACACAWKIQAMRRGSEHASEGARGKEGGGSGREMEGREGQGGSERASESAPNLGCICTESRRTFAQVPKRVYSFEMLTPSFCKLLLDELDNYERSGLPVTRPNSMNNYGLILNQIGMKPMLDEMQRKCVLFDEAARSIGSSALANTLSAQSTSSLTTQLAYLAFCPATFSAHK
eukprot:3495046-Pleurochrysis_carterae.AAC.3